MVADGVPSCGEYVKTPAWSKRTSPTKSFSSENSDSVSPGKPTINEVRRAMSGIAERRSASVRRTISMFAGRRIRFNIFTLACCSGMSR